MKVRRAGKFSSLVVRDQTRILIQRSQRSAGRHLIGLVWVDTEWHNYNGVKYFNLALGNPTTHTRWAFQIWIYFTI